MNTSTMNTWENYYKLRESSDRNKRRFEKSAGARLRRRSWKQRNEEMAELYEEELEREFLAALA